MRVCLCVILCELSLFSVKIDQWPNIVLWLSLYVCEYRLHFVSVQLDVCVEQGEGEVTKY